MQLDYEYLSRIRRAVALYTNRKTSNILDGDFHSIHRGRSMEFDDLKEYTFGDDVHDIDWKSSSRMGDILVRRYMTDRRHNVMFVCDCGHKMLGDTPEGEAKKELALMTFGTIAYITGRNGADYALAYPSENKAMVSLFRSGPEHMEKLIYELEKNIDKDHETSVSAILEEVMSTVHKRMIIFLITDMDGLRRLDGNLLRGITTKHDMLVINIEDAYLTGNLVYDNDRSLYEKLFYSHNKKLHEEEVNIHRQIFANASFLCKQNKVGLTRISRQSQIIDATIDLLERYRHGYYGYITAAI
ncbi:DUF58 domain-containing protein [Butyrivibrio sp. YAB3001]|uniref:DUF58 domain-containing protein n=1 Tax=Butyrivibrio sp. YAB3001 TaxID=1520812 RepID=UPI0008F62ED8|nr:DUF58 domain-containing protein [Butyrivibrio sp. YAB3001]SFC60525.1 Protein of unknown function DUF58 [Butyrivibrio sp. YAB3001]